MQCRKDGTTEGQGESSIASLFQSGVINISSETAEIVNFHFSHYKSMETESCHSNQSSYLTGTKNNFFFFFVLANARNFYAKY